MENTAISVLLVEDNPGDANLVMRAVARAGRKFEVCWATRVSEALDHLSRTEFGVVLLDLSLPDCDGLEIIDNILAIAKDTPIVVLTGLASEETAFAALDRGAQDYLVKDSVTADVLARAIRYAIHRHQNLAEISRLLNEVQESKRQLQRKNRRLAKLYKTAHRFVDNVSHEFRTPLTVIKEYASLLHEGLIGPVNEKQGHFLDIISDRTEDLANMVDDMLDVSKLEAGLLGMWRTEHRIGDILQYVRPGLERKATVKGVSLSIDIDEGLPSIYCDDEKVGRIIINLTINAIKFSGEPGEVRIWARAAPGGDEVSIGVEDNGPGIDAESLEEVFKRFKQVGDHARGSTKGFGLGLNIAKELVDLNFGRMHVASQVGQGSTFSFTVPAARPEVVIGRYLDQVFARGNGGSKVSVVHISVAEDASQDLADGVHAFLNYLLRRHDLLYRTGPREWIFMLAASAEELDLFLARAQTTLDEANRNRPHGPLPEIAFRPRGTWCVDQQGQLLTECVNESVSQGELAHA